MIAARLGSIGLVIVAAIAACLQVISVFGRPGFAISGAG